MSPAAAARETAGGRVGRPAVIVSIVLHVLAFAFAVGLPRFLSSGPSGNKVYVVDLVTLPGGPTEPAAAPAPAPAAAAPAPAKPEVKPPETKPAPEIKKEPPKKAPKPIVLPDKDKTPKKTTKTPPVKTPPEPPKPAEPDKKPDKDEKQDETKVADASAAQETAASQTAAATPPAANPTTATKPGAAGTPDATGAGGGGPGTGPGSGDELDFYIAILKRRIEAAWKRPVSTSRETRTAAVYMELSPTGRLLKLELRSPSGYVPFDRSIMQAVQDAQPFPPFPLSLKLDSFKKTLQFELEPLEGGDSPP